MNKNTVVILKASGATFTIAYSDLHDTWFVELTSNANCCETCGQTLNSDQLI